MHCLVYVIHEPTDPAALEAMIAEALAPHEGAAWDWWQIGGRWTGRFTGYNPEADPANQEPCRLCGETGTRQWESGAASCNGCEGKGIAVKWPTRWQRYSGDTQPITTALLAPIPSAVVTPDGEWVVMPEDTPETARARWEALCRQWPMSAVTIVDAHY